MNETILSTARMQTIYLFAVQNIKLDFWNFKENTITSVYKYFVPWYPGRQCSTKRKCKADRAMPKRVQKSFRLF